MSVDTYFKQSIPENSTWLYRAVIRDERGEPVPAETLTYLVVTLYRMTDAGPVIINNCDHQNILNTGRGTVDTSGNLEITFVPNDNPIGGSATTEGEEHLALSEWKFDGGSKHGRHRIRFTVKNLDYVPL